MVVLELARALNEASRSHNIGLNVSVLNELVALYAVGPKPTAEFRQLAVGKTVDFDPLTLVLGSELMWIDAGHLCSTSFPVASGSHGAEVTRKLLSMMEETLVVFCIHPILHDHLLIITENGLFIHGLSTGSWTNIWPEVERVNGALHILQNRLQIWDIDRVGGCWITVGSTLRRLDLCTKRIEVLAGSGFIGDIDAKDPLVASFGVIDNITATHDGLRLYVCENESGKEDDSAVHRIRMIDFREGSATIGVSTLCRHVGFDIASIYWIQTERLLLGAADGSVQCYDLISRELHVIAKLPFAPNVFPCLSVSERLIHSGVENSIFELDISALFSPLS